MAVNAVTIMTRRDEAADWTSADPVLALGEIGWETDTESGKVGDGVKPWTELPYSLGLLSFPDPVIGSDAPPDGKLYGRKQENWAPALDESNPVVHGNVTLADAHARILADFSNAAIANRALLQSLIADGATVIGIVPNGSSQIAALQAFNAANPTDCAFIGVFISQALAALDCGKSGAGAFVPLGINVGGAERMRISTSGSVGIGGASTNALLEVRGMNNGPIGEKIYNSDGGAGAISQLVFGNNTNEYTAAIELGSSAYTGIGGANALVIRNGLSAPIVFASAGSEVLRLNPTKDAIFAGVLSALAPVNALADTNEIPTTHYMHLRDVTRSAFAYYANANQTAGTVMTFAGLVATRHGDGSYDGVSTFTAATTGIYAFSASVVFTNITGANQTIQASLQRNSIQIFATAYATIINGVSMTLTPTTQYFALNAGDTVRVVTSALTSTMLTTASGSVFSSFSGRRMSEY